MHLINYFPALVFGQWYIALPIVSCGIDGHTAQGPAAVVTPAPGSFPVINGQPCHGPPIGIQENFMAVEPVAIFRVVRAVHAPCVNLPVINARDEYVPVVVGSVELRVKLDGLIRLG